MTTRPSFLSVLGLLTAVAGGMPAASSAAPDTSGVTPLTRQEVRDSLWRARASGTVGLAGESGDTDAVVKAREAFNELQTEVMASDMPPAVKSQAAVESPRK